MLTDELWPDGPAFIRDHGAFQLGTDAVLLADFAAADGAKRACDLGCGTGVVAILLALKQAALAVDGIELQPDWASVARENVCLNGLDGRVKIIDGDLRRHRDFLTAGAYDLVVANPPYYPPASGKLSGSPEAATARAELSCTLDDVCAAAAYLTRWGGRFALVHKPERLCDIVRALSAHGLEPKRLRFVHNRCNAPPSLVLIEARRGSKPSVAVEPPLILTDASGGDSPEVKRIYHRS